MTSDRSTTDCSVSLKIFLVRVFSGAGKVA